MSTVFVLVSDSSYFDKAKRTIIDVRSKGEWTGDLVLILLDQFKPAPNFLKFYNVMSIQFDCIDKTNLLQHIGDGFSNSDKRELNKLNQWEKLHVFDTFFTFWDRVIFIDAGLRVLHNVRPLLELDYKNKILAPIDGRINAPLEFNCQLSFDHPDRIQILETDFGTSIYQSRYFINCLWIYDTKILEQVNKQEMIDAMNTYVVCKTNEMGIMNLVLHFKHKLWQPLPSHTSEGKILFDWSEYNNAGTTWEDYCFIKYPHTILFEEC